MNFFSKLVMVIAVGLILTMSLLTPLAEASGLGARILKSGDVGEDVKALQTVLHDAGYDAGLADGVYGESTSKAVKELQAAVHQTVDGIAGPGTLKMVSPEKNESLPSSAEPTSYTEKIDIVATAYAPGPHDNGKWGSLTYMGTQVRPGVIAVDPKIIPLGSKLYIKFPDGHSMYGVAEDTGGAIKGNRIDIAMSSVDIANDFGVEKVQVYVIH